MGTVAVVFIGRIAVDGRGSALPEHRVGCVPASAKLKLSKVGEAQVMTVDVDDVEEQSRCPGTDAATETQ